MNSYRITDEVGVYYVTFTVVDWLPILIEEKPIHIIINGLNYCIHEKDLRINAYVVMPSHFHGIVFDAKFNQVNLHQTLVNFRKFTGRRLSDYCDQQGSPAVLNVIRNRNLIDRKRQFWQPDWHAEGIFSDEFWKQKVNYIHMNPCRKGLVREPQDWRYSSAAYWYEQSKVDLPISEIAWGD